MPNLTSVGVTSGVPTSGTGTVSTIDALMADGGQATLGAKADAKSSATDTTAVSAMSVLKQISASGQDLLTAVTADSVADDAADAGNSSKIGAVARDALSGEAPVSAAGDRVDLRAGTDRALITRPHCGLGDIVSGNASNTDGSSTQVIAAAAAGIKQYLTSVVLTNTSASNIYVEMKSGTTVKATIPLPANSGAIFNPPVPLPPNAAAEAWNFDPSAAASTVYCTAIGFKSKV